MLIYIIVIYCLILNIYSFVLMGRDKKRASRGQWRIREARFFVVALLGGALGVLLGKRFFRHKTKHMSFNVFIPILLVVNVISLYWVISTIR